MAFTRLGSFESHRQGDAAQDPERAVRNDAVTGAARAWPCSASVSVTIVAAALRIAFSGDVSAVCLKTREAMPPAARAKPWICFRRSAVVRAACGPRAGRRARDREEVLGTGDLGPQPQDERAHLKLSAPALEPQRRPAGIRRRSRASLRVCARWSAWLTTRRRQTPHCPHCSDTRASTNPRRSASPSRTAWPPQTGQPPSERRADQAQHAGRRRVHPRGDHRSGEAPPRSPARASASWRRRAPGSWRSSSR